MKPNGKKQRKHGKHGAIRKALQLLSDSLFLFRAGQKIGELGIVGELRIRLIIFLAGVARSLREPPSVLVKGPTSGGKSTLIKKSLLLFPRNCIVERAGLSGKALAYGKGTLSKKILFINEYRCGKDAQQLLRLLQSEGEIKHESTSIHGPRRSTQTLERTGTPVVLTTTTDDTVFADDETRFLSVWVDESPDQTLAILNAQARGDRSTKSTDLRLWRAALELLSVEDRDFCNPPVWLRFVAGNLPLDRIRVRRDWSRFLAFCQAVALCRRFVRKTKEPLNIVFADYCIAYRILEPVFRATLQEIPSQESFVQQGVAGLNRELGRPVTVGELAAGLKWKEGLVYKHVKRAVRHKLLKYETGGTREKNIKRLVANESVGTRFLPSPQQVFANNAEIGTEVRYVDPITGKRMIIRRSANRK